jgi:hypothetical protein
MQLACPFQGVDKSTLPYDNSIIRTSADEQMLEDQS